VAPRNTASPVILAPHPTLNESPTTRMPPALQRRSPASPVLHWILRIGCVMCFVGHGAFGIREKVGWLPYFNALGFSDATALRLMPIVGTCDILMALSVLLSPCRAVLLYMGGWALFTSFLRPLAGESWWEVLDRAGNYGVPLAFLTLSGLGRSWMEWFEPILPGSARAASAGCVDRVANALRATTGLLLIGHGGYGAFIQKAMLAKQYAAVGLSSMPLGLGSVVQTVGWIELLMGAAVLLAPLPALLVFIFAWKIATELLYPVTGAPFWEFVERGGSYAAPLALFFILIRRSEPKLVEHPSVVPAKGFSP